MIYFVFVFFILGLIFLWKGSSFLVSATKVLSQILGIPQILISITLIAFGTSLPELIVGIFSGFEKVSLFSLGNLLGSSIANLGLVLGISSLIKEIEVDNNTFKKKYPFSIGILVLLVVFFRDLYLDRVESIILIIASFLFLYTISKMKLGTEETVFYKIKMFFAQSFNGESKKNFQKNFILLILGLILLLIGGKTTVDTGVFIAKIFNVPNFIIGVFLVSLGTVLPEFLTSIRASLKDQQDIAFGNAIGSCIINTSFIIGILGLISPIHLPRYLFNFYLPFYGMFLILIYAFLFRNRKISKKEGLVLFLIYLIFIILALYESIAL